MNKMLADLDGPLTANTPCPCCGSGSGWWGSAQPYGINLERDQFVRCITWQACGYWADVVYDWQTGRIVRYLDRSREPCRNL